MAKLILDPSLTPKVFILLPDLAMSSADLGKGFIYLFIYCQSILDDGYTSRLNPLSIQRAIPDNKVIFFKGINAEEQLEYTREPLE